MPVLCPWPRPCQPASAIECSFDRMGSADTVTVTCNYRILRPAPHLRCTKTVKDPNEMYGHSDTDHGIQGLQKLCPTTTRPPSAPSLSKRKSCSPSPGSGVKRQRSSSTSTSYADFPPITAVHVISDDSDELNSFSPLKNDLPTPVKVENITIPSTIWFK